MRQSNRYGRLQLRTFTFTRAEVEAALREYINNHAPKVVPGADEREVWDVEFNEDGYDEYSQPMYTVTQTFTALESPKDVEATA